MEKIKTVALIGAGAVGAYFIPGLSKTLGEDFCIIAEGNRKERLLREGLVINGEKIIPNVRTPEEAVAFERDKGEGIDLVLVTVKYDGLKAILPAVKTLVSDGTTVVSAMNGIDSEEIIAEVIGEEPLLYGYMYISSERKGNEIIYNPEVTKGLVIGEKDPQAAGPERAEAVRSLMERAGIRCRVSDEIIKEQWQKFVLNIGNNLPQAILGVGYGAYVDSEHLRYIHDRLYDEVMKVASVYGITLKRNKIFRGRIRDTARFSTLQDLDAGRHTEIEMFAGVLIKKAKELGIEVPFVEFAYHAVKVLEEKNDGMFDYGK